MEISSFGNLAATDYSLSYSINGNLISTEPGITLLAFGESIVFTFSETVDLSALGSYHLSIALTINDDEDIYCDEGGRTRINYKRKAT